MLAEFQHFAGADMSEQGDNLPGLLDLLQALDHLHDGDDRQGEAAICLAVDTGITDDGGVNGSEHFREGVRVEKGLTHPE